MAGDRMDTTLADVASMDRATLSRTILSLDCDFPLDFSEGQLERLSLEKLRHVYVALCLHGRNGKKA